MSFKISSLSALEILDSRGTPTLEVNLEINNKFKASIGVPSGASTGSHEALELRDNDPQRYNGKGVLKAVNNVSAIFAEAQKKSFEDFREFDAWLVKLDGTANKTKLGGNTLIGCSMAFIKAQSQAEGKKLYEIVNSSHKLFNIPVPMFNVLNGGKHADSGLSIQEFKLVPWGAPSFKEALRWSSETVSVLRKTLRDRNFSVGLGDEGGFAPKLKSNEAALDLLVEVIARAGYKPLDDIAIAIDVAASSFFDEASQKYQLDLGHWLTGAELAQRYAQWFKQYPIISIEDPFFEDAWEDWTEFNKIWGLKKQIIGDDLLVTNPERVKMAVEKKAVNAVLLKPNQIGTIAEMETTINLAKQQNWRTVMSHRSGETCDSSISDLAVAFTIPYMKSGSTARGERLAKYNRLLEIEAELASKAVFVPQRW